MGLFDFVRNAGAKIGIGKSTDEIAAEKAAEEAAAKKESLEAMAKRRNAAREKIAARAAAKRSEENKERFKQARKSNEIENYVKGLGFEVKMLDVRYDDGTAFVSGEAADQTTKERVILAVGNVEGVGEVDEELTVASAGDSDSSMYVVEPGDTLWAIATNAYGDGNRYPEIFEANKPMLEDPDKIYPGQVLRIP